MRAAVKWAAVLALTGALTACDSGEPADVIPAELAGDWVAEPACAPECNFTLTSVANPALSVNATESVFEVEIRMTRAGLFRLTFRPGSTTDGAVRSPSPGVLIVTAPGAPADTIDYTVSGAHLTLEFRRTWNVIDFTGDGVTDPAHASAVFRRR